jgi:putative nucleotidyltransferase with HDIG domain
MRSELPRLSGAPGSGTAVGSSGNVPERPVDLESGGIARALEAAMRLRAPGVHASTPMVRELSVRICRQLGLDERLQGLVDLSARVRDVGMVGLPDAVVLSVGSLSPEQRETLNRHPTLGARLLEGLPGMGAVGKIVRSHHERWDGEGYPDGLAGGAIPLLSRVIAATDAFVAIATDRPYRRATDADIALEHIAHERGAQFDPRIVDALFAVIAGRRPTVDASPDARLANGGVVRGQRPAGARRGDAALGDALVGFDDLPALRPACDNALAAAHAAIGSGELVAAVECSTGLTVAVLRQAQRSPGTAVITNVPDAVALLGVGGVRDVIGTVHRIAFPWRTPEEALQYELRVHGQTVARAADRIAREIGMPDRDDLIACALLHDVGKLVLARARAGGVGAGNPRIVPPEQRVRNERRELHMDHASLGALLIDRWGLPRQLSSVVGAHHKSESGSEPATVLRLADMVVRHAHGDAVDRRLMLRLTDSCGLSVPALRDVLFDLPQSGSQRRRALPSPLSERETDALRRLARGKVYKQIAAELGVSASTIRTHLQSVYMKLEVNDRAQAVLRATELGWI